LDKSKHIMSIVIESSNDNLTKSKILTVSKPNFNLNKINNANINHIVDK